MRRGRIIVAVTLVLCAWSLIAGARPAAAHGLGSEAQPTNYRTTVAGLAPAVPGVRVRVLEAGDKLELTNRTAQEILVLGYRSEPFLRVGPSGVLVNRSAPTVAANQPGWEGDPTAPPGDPAAAPDWRRVSDQPIAVWHDHRSHWHGEKDPAAVQQAAAASQVVMPNWQVPLRVGSRPATLTGSVAWVPGPPAWPWLLLAVLLCVAVVVTARTASCRQALLAAVAAVVLADLLHAVGAWLGTAGPLPAAVAGSGLSMAAWGIGGLAIAKLARGQLETAKPYILIVGVLLAGLGGLTDLAALGSSQVPAGLPPVVVRATVAATLGLGAGAIVASQWWRGALPPVRPGRQPTQRRLARRSSG